jgi:Formin Homology 2 Domain
MEELDLQETTSALLAPKSFALGLFAGALRRRKMRSAATRAWALGMMSTALKKYKAVYHPLPAVPAKLFSLGLCAVFVSQRKQKAEEAEKTVKASAPVPAPTAPATRVLVPLNARLPRGMMKIEMLDTTKVEGSLFKRGQGVVSAATTAGNTDGGEKRDVGSPDQEGNGSELLGAAARASEESGTHQQDPIRPAARRHGRHSTILIDAGILDDVVEHFATTSDHNNGGHNAASKAEGLAKRKRLQSAGAIDGVDGADQEGGTSPGDDSAAAVLEAALKSIPPSPIVASVLDGKVQQNTNIALSGALGRPPYSNLYNLLQEGSSVSSSGSAADGKKSSEMLSSLNNLPPELLAAHTASHVKAMTKWYEEGVDTVLKAVTSTCASTTTSQQERSHVEAMVLKRLTPCERFVLEITARVPNLKQRLSVLQFLSNFSDTSEGLSASVALLSSACNELTESQLLRSYLVSVLVPLADKLGAAGSKESGGAGGVRISLLPQLSTIKKPAAGGSSDKSMTMLSYLCSKLVSTGSVMAAIGHAALPSVKKAASSPSLSDLEADYKKLENAAKMAAERDMKAITTATSSNTNSNAAGNGTSTAVDTFVSASEAQLSAHTSRVNELKVELEAAKSAYHSALTHFGEGRELGLSFLPEGGLPGSVVATAADAERSSPFFFRLFSDFLGAFEKATKAVRDELQMQQNRAMSVARSSGVASGTSPGSNSAGSSMRRSGPSLSITSSSSSPQRSSASSAALAPTVDMKTALSNLKAKRDSRPERMLEEVVAQAAVGGTGGSATTVASPATTTATVPPVPRPTLVGAPLVDEGVFSLSRPQYHGDPGSIVSLEDHSQRRPSDAGALLPSSNQRALPQLQSPGAATTPLSSPLPSSALSPPSDTLVSPTAASLQNRRKRLQQAVLQSPLSSGNGGSRVAAGQQAAKTPPPHILPVVDERPEAAQTTSFPVSLAMALRSLPTELEQDQGEHGGTAIAVATWGADVTSPSTPTTSSKQPDQPVLLNNNMTIDAPAPLSPKVPGARTPTATGAATTTPTIAAPVPPVPFLQVPLRRQLPVPPARATVPSSTWTTGPENSDDEAAAAAAAAALLFNVNSAPPSRWHKRQSTVWEKKAENTPAAGGGASSTPSAVAGARRTLPPLCSEGPDEDEADSPPPSSARHL